MTFFPGAALVVVPAATVAIPVVAAKGLAGLIKKMCMAAAIDIELYKCMNDEKQEWRIRSAGNIMECIIYAPLAFMITAIFAPLVFRKATGIDLLNVDVIMMVIPTCSMFSVLAFIVMLINYIRR